MSYILDALRKADAQRQRDPARGIHAQPLGASAIGRTPRAGRGMRLWSAAAVGLVAVSSGAWYLYRNDVQGVSAPHAEGAVRTPASLTAVAQAQTAPVPGSNGVTPPAVAPAPTPAPANPAAAINPPPAPVQPAAPPRDPRGTSPPATRSAPPSSPAPVAPSAPSAPAARPMPPRNPAAMAPPRAGPRMPGVSAPVAATTLSPPVAGLPPDAPKLVLGGGVYSANPAQRMLIVNGQVFSEGSEVAPGVTLEEMKPRTVVLRFHGARYTVAY